MYTCVNVSMWAFLHVCHWLDVISFSGQMCNMFSYQVGTPSSIKCAILWQNSFLLKHDNTETEHRDRRIFSTITLWIHLKHSAFRPLLVLLTLQVKTWTRGGNMYRYHKNIKLKTHLCFVIGNRNTHVACLWQWKTAEWVGMMGKCGSGHTVISLSLSTLAFNYFADACTIPSLIAILA